MHRQVILQSLGLFRPFVFDARERQALEKVIAFIQETPRCFDRSWVPGHVTGSAFVVSYQCDAVLLVHHKKLDRWLQLGGHSDGHPLTWEVALREAYEESGLDFLKPFGSPQEWHQKRIPWATSNVTTVDPQGGAEHSFAEATLTEQNSEIPWLPFDVDAHEIPPRHEEPGHIHYDLRYLIFADSSSPLSISHESNDLRWVPLDEVSLLTDEYSLLRMVAKVKKLFQPHPLRMSSGRGQEISLPN